MCFFSTSTSAQINSSGNNLPYHYQHISTNNMINRLCLFTAIAAFFNVTGAFQVPNVSQRRLHSQALNSAVLEDLATTEGSTGTSSLPPLLQNMADERREFEMNLGKAMDTLRKDYPTMLHKTPGTNKQQFVTLCMTSISCISRLTHAFCRIRNFP